MDSKLCGLSQLLLAQPCPPGAPSQEGGEQVSTGSFIQPLAQMGRCPGCCREVRVKVLIPLGLEERRGMYLAGREGLGKDFPRKGSMEKKKKDTVYPGRCSPRERRLAAAEERAPGPGDPGIRASP